MEARTVAAVGAEVAADPGVVAPVIVVAAATAPNATVVLALGLAPRVALGHLADPVLLADPLEVDLLVGLSGVIEEASGVIEEVIGWEI